MEFRILGPVEVVSDGTRVPIGGRKQRALLALLLLRANEVLPRAWLVDSLWGDTPPETARASLNVYVSRLRKLLASSGSGAQLVTRSHGYVLELAPDELDLHRFERLAEEAKQALAAGDSSRAAKVLRDALALWRGPALADIAEEPFARVEQARLEELRLRSLEERIEADLALGRHADLVPELERLVAEHPYRERFRRELMLALYRSGRQAEALAAYRDAHRTLADELGIDPGPELQQLEQAILRQDPALAPPTLPRLRDAHEPAFVAAAEEAIAELPLHRRRGVVAAAAAALLIAVVAAVAIVMRRDSAPLTSIGPNAVGVVDPDDNQLVTKITVGSQFGVTGFEHGGSATFAAGSAWIASSGTRALSRIDPQTRAATPIGVASEAFNVAAGTGDIWVTHRLAGISRIDAEEESVAETFTLSAPDGITYSLEGIAVGAGGIWVGAARSGRLRLLSVDASTREVRMAVPLGVRSAHDIALGEGAVWVTNALANRVLRVSVRDRQVVGTIRVAGPTSIAVGAGAVWVASEIDDSVWRIDPATQLVTDQIRVGDGPVDIAVGEGAVWVANSLDGTVSRIDPQSRKVVAAIRVASSLAALAVGGGSVWAVSGGSD